MEHFGLLCPPLPSHVTGMTAIARELLRRGHRATMFNIEDARALTLSEGTEFVPIGTEDHPEGSLADFSRAVAQLKGIPALRFGIRAAEKEADSLLRDVPAAMMSRGVTAIVGDQGSPVCSSIAERLGIPFFSVCNAIAANRDPSLPPSFAGWKPGHHPLIRLRNRAANLMVDSAVKPITRTINRYRSQWGLPALRKLEETFSTACADQPAERRIRFPQSVAAAAFSLCRFAAPFGFRCGAVSFRAARWKTGALCVSGHGDGERSGSLSPTGDGVRRAAGATGDHAGRCGRDCGACDVAGRSDCGAESAAAGDTASRSPDVLPRRTEYGAGIAFVWSAGAGAADGDGSVRGGSAVAAIGRGRGDYAETVR